MGAPDFRLIAVTGCNLSRKPSAFAEETVEGEPGGVGAAPIGLLVGEIAAIEARDHPAATLGPGLLGFDQVVHLAAPAAAFGRRAAERAQIVQGAEDFRKPRHFAFIRWWRAFDARRVLLGAAQCRLRLRWRARRLVPAPTPPLRGRNKPFSRPAAAPWRRSQQGPRWF